MNMPFIVAEVGSNWTNLAECCYSIRAAKSCGADAVKFQLFNHHALYGSGDGFKDPATPMEGSLPVVWLPRLKAQCDDAGIEFMCSAFSPELVAAVDPYVKRHKIASAELTHKRLLEAARDTGKPVILSTGASGVADIGGALEILQAAKYSVGPLGANSPVPDRHRREYFDKYPPEQRWAEITPVTLMYCVASYPAKEIDLNGIDFLRNQFGVSVGYSDHSLDVLCIPYHAVESHGASIIEKHFTAISADTPDAPHSLDPRQFKRMVDRIRGVGSKFHPGPSVEENEMVLRHNRRLIATREVKAGERLIEGENFGCYRSLKEESKALHGFLIDRVNGLVAKNNIKAGDGIGPGDV